MGRGLHNATDIPRNSRTGVGHAGTAIFECTTTRLATVLLVSAYDRFHVFLTFRKPMILVPAAMGFEFYLPSDMEQPIDDTLSRGRPRELLRDILREHPTSPGPRLEDAESHAGEPSDGDSPPGAAAAGGSVCNPPGCRRRAKW